jgi:predicted alpha/beta hydrolase family esterase
MNKALIIHGTKGSSQENWIPWLVEKFNHLNIKSVTPNFPTPEKQNLENWLAVLGKSKIALDENSIIIGHSLGVAFLLSVLECQEKTIAGAYFVSGFVGFLQNPEFDNLNRTFVEKDFDWEKIQSRCPRFRILHSDNDPYVPLVLAKELAENLSSELTVIPNAGHFNSDSGFLTFPFLLELIRGDACQS